jgi:pectate lyase
MMKRLLFFLIILSAPVLAQAQSVIIKESAGWLESAYVKWQPVTGATSYNVYYSGTGITDKKIDTQLIRSYGSYDRADVLGLAAGTYTIKVAPVIGGVEGTSTVTGTLTVSAHDRSGFAFNGGRVPGAYKADGTPKDNAVILYITENTKNTISLNVTGANSNPCVGLEAIMEAYGKGKDTRPLIVRLIGNITDLATMADGDILIEDNQNASCYITTEGVGDDAVCNGWSFRVKDASNVEIRNLAAMNCNSTAGDDFGLQQDNDYVWIHNCDMFYGDAGSDADQIKGDGALDCKGSTYCTFSYNHFWDNGKANLLGLSEDTTTGLYVTYHHNWYDHSDSRHPRVRFYSVHFYNNYLDGNAKYGAGSTMGSSLFVEGNYYRNCKHPMMTSMQGTDVWNSSTLKNDPGNMGTFSGEDGGTIKAFNNIFDKSIGTNNMRFVAYGDTSAVYNISGVINSTTDFDAYLALTRDEQVPATVKSYQGAHVYNNFDTDASLYVKNSVIDDPAIAVAKDTTYAGRVKGGDFKWKFNNAEDDASYLVNNALKAAITNYKTSMVSIQGDSTSTTVVDTTKVDTVVTIPPADRIQNFTLSGKTSTFYAITGNLSTSYGSVTYAGLTLTQCLKIESSTNITFTTTQSGTLALVFSSAYSGTVKIDGTTYTPSAGLISVTIAAGSHTLIKGSGSSYLFYMSVAYPITGLEETEVAKLTLYPNPVVNSLSVSSDVNVEKTEIYSLTGVLVKRTESNIKTIDMSNLSKGCYLVRVYTGQGIIKQLIIKK